MKRLAIKKQLLEVLSSAQGERNKRPELVTVLGWWKDNCTEDIPAWCEYEREVMMNAVNKFRSKLGKPLIGWREISRLESMAMGHSDYSSKFALYCAELVEMDVQDIAP